MGKVLTFKHKGNWSKTEKWLLKANEYDYSALLREYGNLGVQALAAGTPARTGATASSWYYEITKDASGITIDWKNSNVNDNVCVALLIQYDHGTGSGAHVRGVDYINPALRPVFDELAGRLWKEVTTS